MVVLAACTGTQLPPGGLDGQQVSATSSSLAITRTATVERRQATTTTASAPPGGLSGNGGVPTVVSSSTTMTTTTRIVTTSATIQGSAFRTPTAEPTDTPVALATPGGTTPMQISLQLPSVAVRGSTITVSARVSPVGSVCTLTVKYRPAADIPDFSREQVGASGTVAWSWMINANVEPGDWPITVRCENGQPPTSPLYHYVYATNLLAIR